jgi:hypothetical protein
MSHREIDTEDPDCRRIVLSENLSGWSRSVWWPPFLPLPLPNSKGDRSMDTETRTAIEVVRDASRADRDAMREAMRSESEKGRERLMELDRDLDQRIQRQISRSRVDLVFRMLLGAVVLFTVVMITLVVAKAIYRH